MREASFKFNLDQVVKTPFGDDAIIAMLAIDDGGKIYFVKTSKDSTWFKEDQLEEV